MNRNPLAEEGSRIFITPWSEGDNQSMAQDTQAWRELLCAGPPERHKQGTLAPAQCHSLVGVTKIQLFSLGVFGLSCDGDTQDFNQLQTNAPQRLWLEKQLLFPPGCPLYLQNMLFTVKQSLSRHQ